MLVAAAEIVGKSPAFGAVICVLVLRLFRTKHLYIYANTLMLAETKQGSHVLGTWLMCIPPLISQLGLSSELQARYLLRALGTMRILRSRQRIIPDEAAYRW